MEGEPQTAIQSIKSELAIFDGHNYQSTHIKGQWTEIKPSNLYQGTAGTSILLPITKAAGWYLDFNDSFMIMDIAITKDDGSKIGAAEKVAFVNFIAAALFKDMKLTSNDQKIEGDNSCYAYKAYMYTLLSASTVAKQFQLGMTGWCKDQATLFDDVTNEGYVVRQGWTATGETYQVMVPILLDIFMQEKYMLDNMEFMLTLQLNEPKFALQSFEDAKNKYKINVIDCSLWMRYVDVSPSVIQGHFQGLQNMNAIYPYNGHRMFTYLIQASGSSYVNNDFCKGSYPKLIVVGLVNHGAYMGDLKKSPWNFRPHGVQELGLKILNNNIPHRPFKPKFDLGRITFEYLMLFLALGKQGMMSDDNGILLKDFKAGNTLYAFNLAPDLVLNGHAQPARLAPLTIEIKFDADITTPLQLIAFCVYDTQIDVTLNRNVILDSTQTAH